MNSIFSFISSGGSGRFRSCRRWLSLSRFFGFFVVINKLAKIAHLRFLFILLHRSVNLENLGRILIFVESDRLVNRFLRTSLLFDNRFSGTLLAFGIACSPLLFCRLGLHLVWSSTIFAGTPLGSTSLLLGFRRLLNKILNFGVAIIL